MLDSLAAERRRENYVTSAARCLKADCGEDYPRVLSIVLQATHSQYTGPRTIAARATGYFACSDAAFQAASRLLQDDVSEVCDAAFEALRSFGRRGEDTLNRFVSSKTDGPLSECRINALEQSNALPSTLLDPLLKWIDGSSETVFKSKLIIALGSLRDSTVSRKVAEKLAAMLGDRRLDSYLRISAAVALARLGNESASESLSALKAASKDKDPDVRWVSAYALQRLTSGENVLVTPLLTALESSDSKIVDSAIVRIGNIRSGTAAALPKLRKVFDSANDERREAIVTTVGNIFGADPTLAFGILREAMLSHSSQLTAIANEQLRNKRLSIEQIRILVQDLEENLHDDSVTADLLSVIQVNCISDQSIFDRLLKLSFQSDFTARFNDALKCQMRNTKSPEQRKHMNDTINALLEGKEHLRAFELISSVDPETGYVLIASELGNEDRPGSLLEEAGKKAWPALIKAYDHGNYQVRSNALALIAKEASRR